MSRLPLLDPASLSPELRTMRERWKAEGGDPYVVGIQYGVTPMFERRHQPLLPVPLFVARMSKSLAIAVAIDVVFLFAGALGFRELEGLDWPDALLNAGPVV